MLTILRATQKKFPLVLWSIHEKIFLIWCWVSNKVIHKGSLTEKLQKCQNVFRVLDFQCSPISIVKTMFWSQFSSALLSSHVTLILENAAFQNTVQEGAYFWKVWYNLKNFDQILYSVSFYVLLFFLCNLLLLFYGRDSTITLILLFCHVFYIHWITLVND